MPAPRVAEGQAWPCRILLRNEGARLERARRPLRRDDCSSSISSVSSRPGEAPAFPRVCRSRRRRGRRSRRVALRFARERKPIDAGRLQRAGRPANIRAAAPPRTQAPCSPQTRRLRWTSCDRSAPTPTDCCLRDRAVVSAITAAVLLLEESGHDVDAQTAGVRCPSPSNPATKGRVRVPARARMQGSSRGSVASRISPAAQPAPSSARSSSPPSTWSGAFS
jgi:hypothetical protein